MLGARGAIAVGFLYALVVGVLHLVPRHDAILLPLAAWAAMRALDHAKPRARAVALHLTTQLFVLGFLAQLWTVGFEGRNAIWGGIVPWSDALDFYDDALRYVHGTPFTELSQRRPVFSATLALLLRATGQELRLALLVFALTTGLSTALLTAEIRARFGRRAGLLAFVLLLFCARRWTGFVQTEQVGLPLGALAFVCLLRAEADATRDRAGARALALAGIHALTFALVARTGAFFALPAIALWGARRLAGPGERARWLAAATFAGVLGFLTNALVVTATGQAAAPGSDYPLILYGLLHGEDFTFLFAKHPELVVMPVETRVGAMWAVVGHELAREPMLLPVGLARALASFFVSPHGLFGWVWSNPDDHVLERAAEVREAMATHGVLGPVRLWTRKLGAWSFVNATAMGALGVAWVGAWIGAFARALRGRAASSLVAHVVVAVVLSTAFTPAWITSAVQVQTATLGFVVVLPAIVGFFPREEEDERDAASWPSRRALAWTPLVYAALLVVGLRVQRALPAPLPPIAGVCAGAPPENPAAITPAAGPHLLAIAPHTAFAVGEGRSVGLGRKAKADLEASLGFLAKHNPELAASLAPHVRPGVVFVAAFDACDRHVKILIDEHARLDPDTRGFQVRDVDPLATPRVLRLR